MTENEYGNGQGSSKSRISEWRSFAGKLSYKGVVSNIRFLVFLVLLCIFYISNSQKAIDMQRVLNKKNMELKELRWKYMDIKSQLMTAQKESEITNKGVALGLKPMAYPPYRIKAETEKRETN